MIQAVENKKKRAEELHRLLADPEVLKDRNRYQRYAKESASLEPILIKYNEYIQLRAEIEKIKSILEEKHDKDFIAFVESEKKELTQRLQMLNAQIEQMLVEDIPDADRGIIMEIRAGTGGLEASLFAAELFRMYTRFAQKNGWKLDIMNTSPSEAGGIKEVIFSIEGKGVYRKLRFESGVHRVQRVPVTEASGRIHTSAVTVAVLPEAEEVEVKIDPKDIRIDVFRSSGHGGQGVNTADSAVRITHLPTNMVVTCQDERSQLKNKIKAMKVLRSRLLQKAKQQQISKISHDRKSQVGTGDRSEKIRTYNFPDRRITDHRIGYTIHRLEDILEGELDEIISALITADAKSKLDEQRRENSQ